MNYRHAYHAGNFADVLKHGVLCWVVRYLQQKEAPLRLIDTHAGAGVYDLSGIEASKTGEANAGIGRLSGPDLPETLAPYLDLVRSANGRGEIKRYPGSTALMTALARKTDTVLACELHPEDAEALKRTVQSPRLKIVVGDGYRALQANVPPPEKRGLVLIDPPFEEPDEFERLAAAFIGAHQKWPTGVYLMWFPVKEESETSRLIAELKSAAIRKLTLVTLDVAKPEGMSKTGLILCNAPFTFAQSWRAPLERLSELLAQGPNARVEISALSSE